MAATFVNTTSDYAEALVFMQLQMQAHRRRDRGAHT
jgi:hypothetical protein